MGTKPFEHIVSEYGPMVLRVCRATLGPHDAEDAWSDTFIAAMRAYPSLDEHANVEAWLVRIAKNKAIDTHRSNQRRAQPVGDPPEPVADAPTGATWTLLKELPLKQREAIAYRHFAGLSYAEIAGLLGNSEPAARRAVADGMKKLRAMHEEMDE